MIKKVITATALFCLLISASCAARRMSMVFPEEISSIDGGHISSTALGSWENLRQLKPGSRVAVYLENGGRMVQRFREFTESQIMLDINGINRDDVVAVAAAPNDRLLDGVLIGSGVGAGVGVGWGALLTDDGGYSGAVAAISSVYGLGVGAGMGALIDAGLATPEKPVYMREGSGRPMTALKHWRLIIPHQQISNWVRGRKVELMLKDGSYIKGKVTGCTDRRVELVVRDSSEKKYKGRKIGIFTDQISTVAYRENIGGNRLAAGIGGGLTGLFTGFILGGALGRDATTGAPLVIGPSVGILLGSLSGIGLAEHYNWREIMLVVK